MCGVVMGGGWAGVGGCQLVGWWAGWPGDAERSPRFRLRAVEGKKCGWDEGV